MQERHMREGRPAVKQADKKTRRDTGKGTGHNKS